MQAVVFDMDGVIVDSERHWADLESAHILPEAVGPGRATPAEVAGMNVTDLYDYLDRKYGTRISRSAFLDRYDEAAAELYTERAALLPGFRDLLSALRERELLVAVASSSPHDWIDMVRERFDLTGAFDLVVSAEDVDAPSKPDPTIYEYTADRLGVPPDRCVAVEDSAHGVAAAVTAGMAVVGYRADEDADRVQEQDLEAATTVATGPEELREQLLGTVSN